MNRTPDAHQRRCLDRWAQPCVEAMRAAARERGYCLAVHGSLNYDIDVVCIPWVWEACGADDLIAGLRAACSQVTGLPTCWSAPEHSGLTHEQLLAVVHMPCEREAHGRRAWLWQLGGGVCVDCSVIPPWLANVPQPFGPAL